MLNLTTSDIADRLINAASRSGGGTVPATAFGHVPATGYVVSYDGGIELDRIYFHKESASHKVLCAFVESNLATVLYYPNHYFGSWVNNGTTHINVSRVFSEYAQAIDFARNNRQAAIYSLTDNKVIEVPEQKKVSLAKEPFEPYAGKHRRENVPVKGARIDYVHRTRNRGVAASMQALDNAMRPVTFVTPHGIDVRSDYARSL